MHKYCSGLMDFCASRFVEELIFCKNRRCPELVSQSVLLCDGVGLGMKPIIKGLIGGKNTWVATYLL